MAKPLAERGKKFSSTYQPENAGRKPSILKKFIEKTDLSSDDINSAITMIMSKTKQELNELQDDEKQPMLIRLFVKAYMKDFDSGKLDNIEKLLDRAMGKASQNIKQEVKATVKHELDLTKLSDEDILKLNEISDKAGD